MDKVILHCDLNNFYASVECVQNPILWNKPMAVTGNPRTRHGIILAKNEPAKKLGIKTAQTIWEAKKLCPNLICLPPQFELYQEYSKKVREIYKRYTDLVESFGPDECWLDVTHSQQLFGSGEEIANTLRRVVKEETGLTISVGVSFNKFFAKLGSDLKKPDATTVISKENFQQKIWDLPANSLIFIGKKTYEKLKTFNIITIGDLAKADEKFLTSQFGVLGKQYKLVANGQDTTQVMHQDYLDKTKSIGNGTTAIRDLRTKEEIEAMIFMLAEKVTYRMREAGLVGRTAHLSLRNSDLTFSGHSITKPDYTDDSLEFAKMCMEILNTFYKQDKFSVRSVRISLSNLEYKEKSQQINIFNFKQKEKENRLNKSIDAIRQKYGYYAVRRAKTLNRDFINYYESDNEESDEVEQ